LVTKQGRHRVAARAPDVWSIPNHNWLRVTRILRSLRLLGLEDAYRRQRFPVPEDTFRFWMEAKGLPFDR